MSGKIPKIKFGNQWSNDKLSAQIDFFGGDMAYNPDLEEILIGRNAGGKGVAEIAEMLAHEFLHHILKNQVSIKCSGQLDNLPGEGGIRR